MQNEYEVILNANAKQVQKGTHCVLRGVLAVERDDRVLEHLGVLDVADAVVQVGLEAAHARLDVVRALASLGELALGGLEALAVLGDGELERGVLLVEALELALHLLDLLLHLLDLVLARLDLLLQLLDLVVEHELELLELLVLLLQLVDALLLEA